MLESIVTSQERHPKAWLIFLVTIFALLAVIASQLEIDPSFSALVGKDSEYNTQNRILANAYGSNDAVLILISSDDRQLENAVRVDSEQTAAYIESLKESLSTSQYVVDLTGPIYDEERRYAQVIASLQVPETNEGFRNVLSELDMLRMDVGPPPGIESIITGLPVLLQRVTTLLITDNLITVVITFVFILSILFWYTRSWRYTLMTASVPLASLIALAACMVLLDIDVTITLAAVGVLALGLGADYSIHIATHYLKGRREKMSHHQALRHTLDDLKIPITASFITTLAGFTALIFGISPSSISQGIVLSIAIVIIYVMSLVLFPFMLTFFGQKVVIKDNPAFSAIRRGLSKIAVYQAHHSKSVLFIVGILTIIMVYGASQVNFSTSNSNWIPEDDPIASSFREITYTYGDSEELRLVITATEGDLRNVQTARDIAIISMLINGIPNIDSVSSPYDGIEYDSSVMFNQLTYNKSARFNHDYTLTTVDVSTQNLEQDEAGDSLTLAEIRSIVDRHPIHHANVAIYGDAVRFEELGKSLQQDAGTTTMIGLALVFFIASAIYASVVVGLLALIPIVIAVIWAVGLMGFFGVPFTSLSTGIISLVLGIGVDFSIHLVDGIDKAVKKMRLDKAISYTLENAGSAIVLSSITTFAGFTALTFAQLLGTQRLGWSLAFSIVSVFVVSMSIVPAVMSIRWRKRK